MTKSPTGYAAPPPRARPNDNHRYGLTMLYKSGWAWGEQARSRASARPPRLERLHISVYEGVSKQLGGARLLGEPHCSAQVSCVRPKSPYRPHSRTGRIALYGNVRCRRRGHDIVGSNDIVTPPSISHKPTFGNGTALWGTRSHLAGKSKQVCKCAMRGKSTAVR